MAIVTLENLEHSLFQTEAVAQRFSVKKVLTKISQNS